MLHSSLKQHFGFDEFRPGQKPVVEKVIAGESAIAIFPTGSGKSLCYQLSAMHLPHLTLVVSPLLALIQDQLDYLVSRGISAVRIDSSQGREVEMEVMRGIKSGVHKIVMISVERFKNERFRRFLADVPISLMVVDEAHCISEWGHNFRPDYMKLPTFQREFNIKQVLLLTATATPRVISDMCAKFSIAKENVVVTGFYRSNLNLTILSVDEEDKNAELLKLVADKPKEPTIVYVTLQRTAEEVAGFLVSHDVEAVAYHSGMKSEDRERIQNEFMVGNSCCIVATIAFGMGIDKSNIRRVIHYDLPKSIEGYSQEIGRAGRDGQPSDCSVLANLDNVQVLENFIYGDTPERDSIVQVIKEVPLDGSHWELQVVSLSTKCNVRQLPLKTLLVYLEMRGIIKPLYSFYGSYRFSNIISKEEILSKFQGERRAFIQAVFDGSETARVWTSVDVKAICNAYNTPRDRVVAMLEYFDEHGWIKLEATQMTEVFEVVSITFNVDALADDLFALFTKKEAIEVNRIGEMVSLFESDVCLSKRLAEYFGETVSWDKCGHCSVCTSCAVVLKKSLSLTSLDGYNYHLLVDDFVKKMNEKVTSDLITRFLCGIAVPRFTAAKVKSLKSFGVLERYRYQEVRSWVDSNR
jgi:ATP-dependent DNA helicase RecQ